MLKYDPDYAPVIAALEKGDLNKEIRKCGYFGALKRSKVAGFVLDEGQLKLLLENDTAMPVVPRCQRKAVFNEMHSGPLASCH